VNDKSVWDTLRNQLSNTMLMGGVGSKGTLGAVSIPQIVHTLGFRFNVYIFGYAYLTMYHTFKDLESCIHCVQYTFIIGFGYTCLMRI